jgi:sialic acid synthase SpsE
MRRAVDAYKIASYDYGRGDIIGLCDDRKLFISAGQIPSEDLPVLRARYQRAEWWHAVNSHPCSPRQAALRRIVREDLSGYADHTLNPYVCAAAVSLGVYFIEVPVTTGHEFNFGCTLEQFEEIVHAIRATCAAMAQRYGSKRTSKFEPSDPPYGRTVTGTA